MPYANIVFAKIQLKVLKEYRFTDQLTDDGKFMFFLLISLSGIMDNEIPNSSAWIRRTFNLQMTEERVEGAIRNVADVFPKLLIANGLISWENFEEIHNYTVGKSKGTPKELQRLEQKKKKKENKKEKEKEKKNKPVLSNPPSLEDITAYVKEINAKIDPGYFLDRQTAGGWLLKNGQPAVDWKAVVRTWNSNQKKWEKGDKKHEYADVK
jgi:hypothetical protein